MNSLRPQTAFGVVCVLMTALGLLTGCSSFRTELGQPVAARAGGFAEGRTGVNAVIRDLGPPNAITRLPDGFAFLYEHSTISEFQFGFSANLPVIRWLKFVRAWNHIEQDNVLLTFDDQGVLCSVGTGNWQESLGGGGAVQFLFVVMSLSDLSDFLCPADAHGWGKSLLQPLPVTLNSAQSLRNGEHGLQLRNSPDFAGQHTLEMKVPATERVKKKIKRDYQSQPPNPL